MPEALHGLVWVTVGSAFGGMARFFLSGVVGRRVGETFPWGTIVVNVTGSFAIGAIAAALSFAPLVRSPAFWQLAAIGFLGSYTTVSSFSLQTLALARDGDYRRAGGNVVLSVALCLAAAALGYGTAVLASP